MPRFSLIAATLGRTNELETLLVSLEKQTYQDFELFVIDQNPDDRLVTLLDNWASRMTQSTAITGQFCRLKHLRTKPGLSAARNLGIFHSSGDFLAFPDDDCWYPPETLRIVDSWFTQNENYGVLCLGSKDSDGQTSGNRWNALECDLTTLNVFRASVSYSIFLRRPHDDVPLIFDENLGVGTKYGSGEDTDLLLTLMEHRVRGRFFSLAYVGHPRKGHFSVTRATQYGAGWGRVLAKHSLPMLCCAFVAFDCMRAVRSFLQGNRVRSATMWAHARSVLQAYLSSAESR